MGVDPNNAPDFLTKEYRKEYKNSKFRRVIKYFS